MRVAVPLICLSLLPALTLAQDKTPPPPQVSVRVTAVKGTGKRAKDVKPAIPPDLAELEPVLIKCPYDRYHDLSAPTARGAAKTDMAFKQLPADHSAVIRWERYEKKGGDILLKVQINKTVKKTEKKLASMDVRLKDGASYLIKVPGAYADGDLLLIVTVSREPFPKDE